MQSKKQGRKRASAYALKKIMENQRAQRSKALNAKTKGMKRRNKMNYYTEEEKEIINTMRKALKKVTGKIIGLEWYIDETEEEVIFEGWKIYITKKEQNVYGEKIETLLYDGATNDLAESVGGSLENAIGKKFNFYCHKNEIWDFEVTELTNIKIPST